MERFSYNIIEHTFYNSVRKEAKMKSNKFKNWIATLDVKTCMPCRSRHGKIYSAQEVVLPSPPLHPHCRCVIKWLKAYLAGTATILGNNGADWWLKWTGELPDYYITQSEAIQCGFIPVLGNLSSVAPGKMLTKGTYKNRNEHLPQVPGRTWKEADINYLSGYRGPARILFSNDGLLFVTYDHYQTFQAII
ncbi:MAG: minor capsid protein [Oscillospiraceae bacterium]|nr:minor capsid protein [Oscillospiraceae bacterium]